MCKAGLSLKYVDFQREKKKEVFVCVTQIVYLATKKTGYAVVIRLDRLHLSLAKAEGNSNDLRHKNWILVTFQIPERGIEINF